MASAIQPLHARLAELAQELEDAHKKTEATGMRGIFSEISRHHIILYSTSIKKTLLLVSYNTAALCLNVGAAVTATEAKLAKERQANQTFRQVLLEHKTSRCRNSATSTNDLLAAVLAHSVMQTEQHQQYITRVTDLRHKVQHLSSELQKSQVQASSAGTMIQDLQFQLQAAQQAAAAAALQDLSHTNSVQGLKRQLRQAQRAARASQAEFQAAEDDLQDVYASLADMAKQRDRAMKDVQRQWDQLQCSHSSRSNTQQQLTDAEQQQLSELAQKLSDAEQQLTNSEHRRAELDQMLRDENESDSCLQQHVAGLTAELQCTKQALRASHCQAADLQRQVNSQHSTHTQQLKILQQQLDERTAELHQSAQTAAENKTIQTQVSQRECKASLTDDMAKTGETKPSLQTASLQQPASQLHAHLAAAQEALAVQADAAAPTGQNDALQPKLAAAKQLTDDSTSGSPQVSTILSTAHKDSAAAAFPMADEPSRAFQQQIGDMRTALNKAGEASEPVIEPIKDVQPEQPQQSALATGSVSPRSQLTGSSKDDLGLLRHEPSSYVAMTNQAGSSVPVEDQSVIPGSSEEHKETNDPASKQEGCQKEGHLPSHSMAGVPQGQAQTRQGQV